MDIVRDCKSVVTVDDEISNAASRLLQYVEEWTSAMLNANAEQLPCFAEAEDEVASLVKKMGVAALTQILASYESSSQRVDVEGRSFRRMPSRTKGRYLSLWGPVEVARYLYREDGVHNGPTVVPLELRAGLPFGRLTPDAAEAVAHLYQSLPARDAFATCKRLKVLDSSRSSLLRFGQQIGASWEDSRDLAEATLAADIEVASEARGLCVSVDRVTLPMIDTSERSDNKRPVVYRQAYCAVVSTVDANGKPLGAIRYGQLPTPGGRDMLERAMRRDVDAILKRAPSLKLVGVADGAVEMQALLDRVLGPHKPVAVSIDFWHLIEKLSAAVTATGRLSADHVPTWKAKLANDDRAIDAIDATLRRWMADYHEDDVPAGLYDAFTYLDNNKERMRYAELRRLGLPIGSGHVEATCKTVVAVRMKRAGARWRNPGAQACLLLRALACSNPERWRDAMTFLMGTFRKPVTPIGAVLRAA